MCYVSMCELLARQHDSQSETTLLSTLEAAVEKESGVCGMEHPGQLGVAEAISYISTSHRTSISIR